MKLSEVERVLLLNQIEILKILKRELYEASWDNKGKIETLLAQSEKTLADAGAP